MADDPSAGPSLQQLGQHLGQRVDPFLIGDAREVRQTAHPDRAVVAAVDVGALQVQVGEVVAGDLAAVRQLGQCDVVADARPTLGLRVVASDLADILDARLLPVERCCMMDDEFRSLVALLRVAALELRLNIEYLHSTPVRINEK